MASRQQLEQALQDPNVRKFLDLLAYTEGTLGNGYHTAFGGGRLPHLNDHPRYSKSFKQTDGKTNKTSAAGRYQFLKGTWDGLAKQYGFKDFGPRNQDLGAVALLAQNGALPHILKGDFGKAVSKAGGTWASLPSSPHPQPTKSWKKVNDFLGGKIAIPPQKAPQQQEQQAAAETQIEAPENNYKPDIYQPAQALADQQSVGSGLTYNPAGGKISAESLSGDVGAVSDEQSLYAANELSPSMGSDDGFGDDLDLGGSLNLNINQPDWKSLASEIFEEQLPQSLAPMKVSSAIKGAVKNILG